MATIVTLGQRLIGDTKAVALAQVDVAKQTVLAYVRAAKAGVILLVVALLLFLASLPVLIAAIGMTLAIWIGVAGGLFAAAGGAIVIAGLLAFVAARMLGGIGERVG